MVRPPGSERRLIGEYASDLRSRQPRGVVRRRLRTLRAFSRFLAPRRLGEASPEDVSEWSITRVDEDERAERRAELADFYQWHRSRAGVSAATDHGGAGPGAGPEPAEAGPVAPGLTVEAPPERDEAVVPAPPPSAEERGRRTREPVRVDLRPPRPKSRYSWPKRLATALVLGVVTVLWMVTLILPDRRTSLTTTTTTSGGRSRPSVPTTAPMHPRGEVTVLAVNASGRAFQPDRVMQALSGAGYKVVPPEEAPAPVPISTVYWTPGYEREARALADAVEVPAQMAVAPMPDPPPVPDLKHANLVMVLGEDLPPQP